MFHYVKKKTTLQSIVTTCELIYHASVRSVRQANGNAFVALLSSIATAVLMVLAFYFMFSLLGVRSAGLRGDFLLYIMSGIFMFLTHTRTVSSVVGADPPTSPMMLHAPLNTLISICAAALSVLYIQTMTMLIVLYFYHVLVTPIIIEQPVPAYGMFLLSWASGLALGLVLLAIKPWFPGFVALFLTIYRRASMIASGKMFVANTLPGFMIAMFDWHPLFHTIDQTRGFVFINYFPRNSMWEYTLYLMLTMVIIGMMGEFYTRQYASASWNARR